MRTELEQLDEARSWFSGKIVDMEGKNKKIKDGKTILLRDVALLESQQELCNHTWILYSRGFETLSVGQEISFLATVRCYKKMNGEHDYGLNFVVWPQPYTRNPLPKPLVDIPKSKQEADELLGKLADKYTKHAGFSRKIGEWKDGLLESLVKEGWGDFEPRHFEFEASRSDSFAELCRNVRRDRHLLAYCELASYINGYQPIVDRK